MKIKFEILYGLLYSIAGLGIGGYISVTSIGEGYDFFWLYATLAGFLTGYLLSFFFIVRRNNYKSYNLLVIAPIVGLISHWLCWYLMAIELNVRYWIFGEHFFQPPVNLLESLYGVFVFCLWSWLFFGWITVLWAVFAVFIARDITSSTRSKTGYTSL